MIPPDDCSHGPGVGAWSASDGWRGAVPELAGSTTAQHMPALARRNRGNYYVKGTNNDDDDDDDVDNITCRKQHEPNIP